MSSTTPIRSLVQSAARLAHSWQCMLCNRWFESDVPAQVCPSCG